MTSRKIPESAVENLVSDLEGKANVANTVTTNTTQTITGQKEFTAELRRKSTVIDITTQPENYRANNVKFVDKNNNIMGYIENAQQSDGSIKTGIHARNKDGYQPNIGVYAPLSGTTGAYATAPSTPDNAPANAIVTKDKIANMVTTNTAQTISGSKRFTQPSAGMSIELTADTNQQTVPAKTTARQLGLYRNATYTKGDGFTSWLQGGRGSDGWTTTELYARRFLESDSQEIVNYIKAGISPNGVPAAYTKTPPAGSAGEEIVTAGWFRQSGCTARTVIEAYRNGANWYRIWSDGWKEQGGFSPNGSYIVTFLKPFSDESYTALCTFQDGYSENALSINSRTNTSFIINRGTEPTDIGSKAWYACGY